MYSITSRSSFEEVSTFHQQILRVSLDFPVVPCLFRSPSLTYQVKDKDYFPVVVVANKCDLEYERQVQPHGESDRGLTSMHIAYLAEGRELAKRFNAQCIETSAKQRVNVDEAFIAVVRAIRRYQKVGCERPAMTTPAH